MSDSQQLMESRWQPHSRSLSSNWTESRQPVPLVVIISIITRSKLCPDMHLDHTQQLSLIKQRSLSLWNAKPLQEDAYIHTKKTLTMTLLGICTKQKLFTDCLMVKYLMLPSYRAVQILPAVLLLVMWTEK